jgi:hypothetical protein
MKKNYVAYVLLIFSIPSLGGAAENFVTPQTAWGFPDLQGVWNFSSDTPMQRPAKYGGRKYLTEEELAQIKAETEASDKQSDAAIPGTGVDESYNDFWIESAGIGQNGLTSHIFYPEDGRMPATKKTAKKGVFGQRPVRNAIGVNFATNGPEDRPLSDRCIVGFNSGPPVSPSFYNNNLQIIQNKDHVVIITEMIHDARIVPLGDQAHAPTEIGLWSGDSRGHWEGDSLVVETKNFNGLTNSFSSVGSSEDKRLIEKFTRASDNRIDYEFTVNDPSTFTHDIKGIIPIYKVAGLIYEYACHEGNYGMANILRGARVEESLAKSDQ